MTDREKLIALFDHFGIKDRKEQEYMVDSLIANGVTVQEWISVDDRLPDEPTRCLIYKKGENIYWMPLPQPPKGE